MTILPSVDSLDRQGLKDLARGKTLKELWREEVSGRRKTLPYSPPAESLLSFDDVRAFHDYLKRQAPQYRGSVQDTVNLLRKYVSPEAVPPGSFGRVRLASHDYNKFLESLVAPVAEPLGRGAYGVASSIAKLLGAEPEKQVSIGQASEQAARGLPRLAGQVGLAALGPWGKLAALTDVAASSYGETGSIPQAGVSTATFGLVPLGSRAGRWLSTPVSRRLLKTPVAGRVLAKGAEEVGHWGGMLGTMEAGRQLGGKLAGYPMFEGQLDPFSAENLASTLTSLLPFAGMEIPKTVHGYRLTDRGLAPIGWKELLKPPTPRVWSLAEAREWFEEQRKIERTTERPTPSKAGPPLTAFAFDDGLVVKPGDTVVGTDGVPRVLGRIIPAELGKPPIFLDQSQGLFEIDVAATKAARPPAATPPTATPPGSAPPSATPTAPPPPTVSYTVDVVPPASPGAQGDPGKWAVKVTKWRKDRMGSLGTIERIEFFETQKEADRQAGALRVWARAASLPTSPPTSTVPPGTPPPSGAPPSPTAPQAVPVPAPGTTPPGGAPPSPTTPGAVPAPTFKLSASCSVKIGDRVVLRDGRHVFALKFSRGPNGEPLVVHPTQTTPVEIDVAATEALRAGMKPPGGAPPTTPPPPGAPPPTGTTPPPTTTPPGAPPPTGTTPPPTTTPPGTTPPPTTPPGAPPTTPPGAPLIQPRAVPPTLPAHIPPDSLPTTPTEFALAIASQVAAQAPVLDSGIPAGSLVKLRTGEKPGVLIDGTWQRVGSKWMGPFLRVSDPNGRDQHGNPLVIEVTPEVIERIDLADGTKLAGEQLGKRFKKPGARLDVFTPEDAQKRGYTLGLFGYKTPEEAEAAGLQADKATQGQTHILVKKPDGEYVFAWKLPEKLIKPGPGPKVPTEKDLVKAGYAAKSVGPFDSLMRAYQEVDKLDAANPDTEYTVGKTPDGRYKVYWKAIPKGSKSSKSALGVLTEAELLAEGFESGNFGTYGSAKFVRGIIASLRSEPRLAQYEYVVGVLPDGRFTVFSRSLKDVWPFEEAIEGGFRLTEESSRDLNHVRALVRHLQKSSGNPEDFVIARKPDGSFVVGMKPTGEAMTAWHGSTKQFVEFSMKFGGSRLGISEGYGVYFTPSPSVARGYAFTGLTGLGLYRVVYKEGVGETPPSTEYVKLWEGNLGRGDVRLAGTWAYGTDKPRTASDLRSWLGDLQLRLPATATLVEGLKGALDILSPNTRVQLGLTSAPGYKYAVELHVTPAELLYWFAPMTRQPRRVHDAFSSLRELAVKKLPAEKAAAFLELLNEYSPDSSKTGEQAYWFIADATRDYPELFSDIPDRIEQPNRQSLYVSEARAASNFLLHFGVKGNLYNRSVGGAPHYVVWDNAAIEWRGVEKIPGYDLDRTAPEGSAMDPDTRRASMVPAEPKPPGILAEFEPRAGVPTWHELASLIDLCKRARVATDLLQPAKALASRVIGAAEALRTGKWTSYNQLQSFLDYVRTKLTETAHIPAQQEHINQLRSICEQALRPLDEMVVGGPGLGADVNMPIVRVHLDNLIGELSRFNVIITHTQKGKSVDWAVPWGTYAAFHGTAGTNHMAALASAVLPFFYHLTNGVPLAGWRARGPGFENFFESVPGSSLLSVSWKPVEGLTDLPVRLHRVNEYLRRSPNSMVSRYLDFLIKNGAAEENIAQLKQRLASCEAFSDKGVMTQLLADPDFSDGGFTVSKEHHGTKFHGEVKASAVFDWKEPVPSQSLSTDLANWVSRYLFSRGLWGPQRDWAMKLFQTVTSFFAHPTFEGSTRMFGAAFVPEQDWVGMAHWATATTGERKLSFGLTDVLELPGAISVGMHEFGHGIYTKGIQRELPVAMQAAFDSVFKLLESSSEAAFSIVRGMERTLWTAELKSWPRAVKPISDPSRRLDEQFADLISLAGWACFLEGKPAHKLYDFMLFLPGPVRTFIQSAAYAQMSAYDALEKCLNQVYPKTIKGFEVRQQEVRTQLRRAIDFVKVLHKMKQLDNWTQAFDEATRSTFIERVLNGSAPFYISDLGAQPEYDFWPSKFMARATSPGAAARFPDIPDLRRALYERDEGAIQKLFGVRPKFTDLLQPMGQLIKEFPFFAETADLAYSFAGHATDTAVDLWQSFVGPNGKLNKKLVMALTSPDSPAATLFSKVTLWEQAHGQFLPESDYKTEFPGYSDLTYRTVIEGRQAAAKVMARTRIIEANAYRQTVKNRISNLIEMRLPKYDPDRRFTTRDLDEISEAILDATWGKWTERPTLWGVQVAGSAGPYETWTEAVPAAARIDPNGPLSKVSQEVVKPGFEVAAATMGGFEHLLNTLFGEPVNGRRDGRGWYMTEIRVGDWRIAWYNTDPATGRTSFVGMQGYKTPEEAVKQATKLEEQGFLVKSWNRSDQFDPFRGVAADLIAAYADADNRLFQAVLKHVAGNDPLRQQIVDEINDAVQLGEGALRMVTPPTFLERRLVPGREELNMMEGLIHYVDSKALGLSKRFVKERSSIALHMPELLANPAMQRQARIYLNDIVESRGKSWHVLNDLNFFTWLGFNLSCLPVELTQLWLVHTPYLMREGALPRRAYELSGHGFEVAGKWYYDKNLIPTEIRGAIERAVKERLIDLGFIQELQLFEDANLADLRSIATQGSVAPSPYALAKKPLYWLLQTAKNTYGLATRFNSISAFASLYEMARRDKGLSPEDSYQFAKQVRSTMYGGGQAARPLILSGWGLFQGVGGVLYSLQSYMANTTFMYIRWFKEMCRRSLPVEERKDAGRAFATAMASQFAVGGVLGLPMVSSVVALLEQAFDVEIRKNARDLLMDLAGDDEDFGRLISEGALNGLVNTITPFDFGSRFQLGQMFGIDPYAGFSWKNVVGPIGSTLSNYARGISDFFRGEVGSGLERIAPAGIKGVISLVRDGFVEREEGTGDLIFEPTPVEIAGRLVGLKPKRLTYHWQQKTMQQRTEELAQQDRDKFHKEQAAILATKEDVETVKANVLKRAAEVKGYEPIAGIRRIVEMAQDRKTPIDLTRVGSREAVGRVADIARSFERPPSRLSEQQRLVERKRIELLFGLPAPPSPTEIARAQLIDRMLQLNPTLTVAQARAMIDDTMRKQTLTP